MAWSTKESREPAVTVVGVDQLDDELRGSEAQLVGAPFTTTLSAQQIYLLRSCGYRPLQVVVGTIVYSMGLRGVLRSVMRAFVRGEMADFSHLQRVARDLAISRMRERAREVGADGVVGGRRRGYPVRRLPGGGGARDGHPEAGWRRRHRPAGDRACNMRMVLRERRRRSHRPRRSGRSLLPSFVYWPERAVAHVWERTTEGVFNVANYSRFPRWMIVKWFVFVAVLGEIWGRWRHPSHAVSWWDHVVVVLTIVSVVGSLWVGDDDS